MTGEDAASREVLRLLVAPWLTEAVVTAVKLGVADRLGDGPATCAELADSLALSPDPLRRLLRLLTAIGVVSEDDGRFALTETGERLHGDHPASLRHLALLYHSDAFTAAWRGLPEAVRTGEQAFRSVHGRPVYEYLDENPAEAALFDAGMAVGSSFAAGLPSAFDFSETSRVVDVGGGDGTRLAGLLKEYPHLHGDLLERRAELRAARDRLAPYVAEGRCRLIEGDLRREVPTGADVYLLCRVLHNWADPACHDLLARCADALAPKGHVLVIERVLPDQRHPWLSLAFDLHMMVMTNGRERTASEYEALLRPAGLRTRDIRDLSAEMRLLVAVPVDTAAPDVAAVPDRP